MAKPKLENKLNIKVLQLVQVLMMLIKTIINLINFNFLAQLRKENYIENVNMINYRCLYLVFNYIKYKYL